MGKGLITFLKQALNKSKYWNDLSTTLTEHGTVIRKSLHRDGNLKAITKTYAKGSHMADLGVKETRTFYSQTVNNMASHKNKPHYVLDGISVTLNNGKKLNNLHVDEARKFFKAANIYNNYSSLKV